LTSEIIYNAKIVAMDEAGTIIDKGYVRFEGGIIVELGAGSPPEETLAASNATDAMGRWLLPGFVQSHVHLCQTLFRGTAENLSLMEWLRSRIWPMEASHDEESISISARLGIYELLSGGTSSIMDMGTTHGTSALFSEAAKLGIRAVIGRAIMDYGHDVPPRLKDEGRAAMEESVSLANKYHGAEAGRLRYVFSPRFLLSVEEGTMREISQEARRLGCMIQTHACENQEEAMLVVEKTGDESLKFLEKVGMLGPDVTIAHMIHLTASEFRLAKETQTNVAHCPSANMKLGSGIARTMEMTQAGINVSLGADGAACNNNLSIFTEMRLAGLLQNLRFAAKGLKAEQIVRMATNGGARALGLQDEIGSLKIGKKADFVLLDPRLPHSSGETSDVYSRIVYSMDARNVVSTYVDGVRLYHEGKVKGVGIARLMTEADEQIKKIDAAYKRLMT